MIGGVFIIVVAYGVSSGIEIIGRMGEMGFPIIIALALLEMIFAFSVPALYTQNVFSLFYMKDGEKFGELYGLQG
ncbi:hypothetical protein GCM10020331_003380 [Ectobacillus funiculus]